MDSKYISYERICDFLPIALGETLYISSDITALMYWCMKNGEVFSPDKFLDLLIKKVGEQGTILIPTFNFDFSNKGSYDYCHTPCTTGALGNAALKRADFKRTWHPMHSFAVYGKDKEYLCGLRNSNSFGANSPFQYLLKKNALQLMVNTDYQRSMTFVHYVEFCAKVPYRFNKVFSGTYIGEDRIPRKVECDYPARYLELGSVEKFNRIGKILEEQDISHVFKINNMNFILVRLGDSFPVILKDINENMAANIYDFKVERKDIFLKKFKY